jgi:hypothetical protein
MTESRVALFVLSPRPVDVRLGARVITSKSWSVEAAACRAAGFVLAVSCNNNNKTRGSCRCESGDVLVRQGRRRAAPGSEQLFGGRALT